MAADEEATVAELDVTTPESADEREEEEKEAEEAEEDVTAVEVIVAVFDSRLGFE